VTETQLNEKLARERDLANLLEHIVKGGDE
jgi:hypothetical protein